MKNKFVILTTVAFSAATLLLNTTYAQSPMDLFKKATEAAAKPEPQRPPVASQNETALNAAIPGSARPQATIGAASDNSGMQNPEVEMVLTGSRASSWTDAQKKAVTKVNDGDPLWLYLKTAKPIKDYIHRMNRPEAPAELNLVIAPQGVYRSVSQNSGGRNTVWELRPEEMQLKEITISLAPGASRYFLRPGSHLSGGSKADFFLEFIAGDKATRGQWQNEIFVLGSKRHINANGEESGGISIPMAVASILVDVPNGISKYKALRNENCSPSPEYNRPCKVRQ
jgi:hypothetical protein